MRVPELRIRLVNQQPVRKDGRYVLYWMTAFRRVHSNFALQRAVEWARELGCQLVVLEALRMDYPWASDRLHQFIIEGMVDNEADLASTGVEYFPFIEQSRGQGRGLLRALSQDAAVVVTDDFPCFFLPHMVEAAGKKLELCLEAVDSNGLLPLRATNKVFGRAYDFRRFLHKNLAPHLSVFPRAMPLKNFVGPTGKGVSAEIKKKWPPARLEEMLKKQLWQKFAIDHSVAGVDTTGGSRAGRLRLQRFLSKGLASYPEHRNHPDEDGASGLSPYLHFGHVSVHQVFDGLMKQNKSWSPAQLGPPTGSREGWWGLPPAVESFLDELVTWREVGYNMAAHNKDYDKYKSLPAWALKTLDEHRMDERPEQYSLEQLETAATEDEIWNAAQRQLLREGRMHNYLRMLWGKKIYEWSAGPEEALHRMIELNNKYALDGRNPNSYSGIFWVLGRYDRAWGPERPIYGKIRYMTSDSTKRKLRMKNYLKRYGSMTLF